LRFDEYYKRLKLTPTASPAEVKRAYRRLRAKYHPDRNKGREAAVEPEFKRIQEAFEILTGQRETVALDQVDASNENGTGDAVPDDSSRSPAMRGANCLVELFVPVEVAIAGGDVKVSYPVKGPCHPCPAKKNGQPCARCSGTGISTYWKSETVIAPRGAWDGQRLVVNGAGHPGLNGGPPGDAIFQVVIICDATFRRDGADLACDMQIDFVTAALGGIVERTFFGRAVQIRIAPNTQQASRIRLAGLGLPARDGSRGDLTLHVALTMPAAIHHLTAVEREQLREMFSNAERRSASPPISGDGNRNDDESLLKRP